MDEDESAWEHISAPITRVLEKIPKGLESVADKADCVTCKYLSTATQHSICQRATSEHYSRKVLQCGVHSCSQWEQFKKVERTGNKDRDWLRLIG
jgi:hypothetical protein